MRWAKPLDLALIKEAAQTHQALVTVEDGTRLGGAGSAVIEALQEMDMSLPVLTIGFDDAFTEHGDHAALMQHYQLTAQGIAQRIDNKWPHLVADKGHSHDPVVTLLRKHKH